jgi:uncharacterized protein (DUF4415 family)
MSVRYEKVRAAPRMTREQARRLARKAIARTTDAEEAAIIAAAENDPDNPPLTEAQLAKFRPMAEVRPDLLRRLRGQRGPQKTKPVKVQVTLRLDPDVVARFRAKGEGWQSRINATLRKALKLPKTARVD